MEQNRFKFEQDMHDIKGAKNVKKKTKDKTGEGLIKQKKQVLRSRNDNWQLTLNYEP
jgi:type III secretory pathway component EscU